MPAVVELHKTFPRPRSAIGGRTRDVGAGGVYVVSQEEVATGTRVRVSVHLGHLGRMFSSFGSVVRREAHGFAVAFDNTVELAWDVPGVACR